MKEGGAMRPPAVHETHSNEPFQAELFNWLPLGTD